MKFVKIPTSSRDINDYIYSHLLPRNSAKSDLNGINYTNIRNVTNEPFSKRTNIRIFVRFDE